MNPRTEVRRLAVIAADKAVETIHGADHEKWTEEANFLWLEIYWRVRDAGIVE